MQNKTRTYQQKAGLRLFTLGLLLSSIIALIAIWGDLEASLFDVSIRPQESLSTLRCPILITEKESGTIRASFKNESEKSVEISVRAHVSQGFVTYLREENTRLPISAAVQNHFHGLSTVKMLPSTVSCWHALAPCVNLDTHLWVLPCFASSTKQPRL